jgi:hypothetical protein
MTQGGIMNGSYRTAAALLTGLIVLVGVSGAEAQAPETGAGREIKAEQTKAIIPLERWLEGMQRMRSGGGFPGPQMPGAKDCAIIESAVPNVLEQLEQFKRGEHSLNRKLAPVLKEGVTALLSNCGLGGKKADSQHCKSERSRVKREIGVDVSNKSLEDAAEVMKAMTSSIADIEIEAAKQLKEYCEQRQR